MKYNYEGGEKGGEPAEPGVMFSLYYFSSPSGGY